MSDIDSDILQELFLLFGIKSKLNSLYNNIENLNQRIVTENSEGNIELNYSDIEVINATHTIDDTTLKFIFKFKDKLYTFSYFYDSYGAVETNNRLYEVTVKEKLVTVYE